MPTEIAIGIHHDAQYKLGLNAPRPGVMALEVGDFLTGAIPAYPDNADYLKGVQYGNYQNDRYGVCHDDQTEVLTELGWQKWSDYDGSSLLGTMSQATGYLEFQAPLALKRFNYDGPMAYSDHRSLNFALTPEHRMYFRPYRIPSPYVAGGAGYEGWRFGTVADMPHRTLLPGATTGFIGTGLKRLQIGNREWDGDDLLRLLAVFVSDGWLRSREKSRHEISFCCFRDDRRAMVVSLAQRLGIQEAEYRRGVWSFRDPALAEWLRANAFTDNNHTALSKRVPDLVKVASQEQIAEFLAYFGDQSIQKTSGSRQFYSNSKRLIDDLQELLLRIGKRGNIYKREPREGHVYEATGQFIQSNNPSYTIHECQEREVGFLKGGKKNNLATERYKGEVFCATVPNSTLITRRDGHVLVSGNCGPVSAANHRRMVTAYLKGQMVAPSQQAVFDLYRRSGNPQFDPNTGADDNGVIMIAMLQELIRGGIDGVKALAYARVNVAKLSELDAAIAVFGGVLFGVNLQSAQQQQTNTGVWDYAPSGPWGGHAVMAGAFPKDDGNDVITWGKRVRMKDKFIQQQAMEAYVVIWPEHLQQKQFYDGLDVWKLADAYEALTGKKFPRELLPPKPNPGPIVPTTDTWTVTLSGKGPKPTIITKVSEPVADDEFPALND